MRSKLGIYNWPPVYISWGREKVGFRLDTYAWVVTLPVRRCLKLTTFTFPALRAEMHVSASELFRWESGTLYNQNSHS